MHSHTHTHTFTHAHTHTHTHSHVHTHTDGLDLSRSSLIRGRGVSATPISFPYAVITPEMQAHWRVLDDFRSVPFSQWNLKAIVAWMEAGIGE